MLMTYRKTKNIKRIELNQLVQNIDKLIRAHHCFDFHILKYDGRTLTIGGGTNLTYSHSLEIAFTDVFFIHGFFETFSTDTTNQVFYIPDQIKARQLNLEFEIEQGYKLFVFKTDNYENDVYIAAKDVNYEEKIVKYYEEETE